MFKLPTPEDSLSLSKAISFFTGNAHQPRCVERDWTTVLDRLKDCEATPEEFCFYLVYVAQGKNAGLFSVPRMLLQARIWNGFREYIRGQPTFCHVVNNNQRERIDLLQAHDIPVARTLLAEAEHLNPALRCELALEKLEGKDLEDVLNAWSKRAYYFLVGVPQFRKYTPKLIAYLDKEGKKVTL